MDKLERTDYLASRLFYYLKELEAQLGPRDQKFAIGKIKFCGRANEPPHIHLNENDQTIDIYLPQSALRSARHDLGEWHLRHEAVHLIDPYFTHQYTNVLEEGLATCFQMDEALGGADAGVAATLPGYKQAKDLVQKYYNIHLFDAIRLGRERGIKIGDLHAEYLLETVPHMTPEDAKRLAQRFDNLYELRSQPNHGNESG